MTYSIVARDVRTGEMGVAVQSHWFSVGPIVTWAEAGVGVVATQAMVDPSYGPNGLERLRAGQAPDGALADLTAADERPEIRQVAVVDAAGRVAAHTGAACIADAGHHVGEGYSCQANMMRRSTVWDAMAKAFEASDGEPLAFRLLAALDAAEAEGGDIRGRQSAALVVVAADGTGRPWVDRKVDVRVDDHTDPLGELRRLVELAAAYEHMNDADERLAAGDAEGALHRYESVVAALGPNPEARFWRGVMLGSEGELERGRADVAAAAALDPGWAELLRRLPASGMAPDDLPARLLD